MGLRWKLLLTVVLFFVALISGYFAFETYINYVLKEKFDRRLSKLPFSTAYSRFYYNPIRNDIEIKDFTLKDGNITITVEELLIDLPYDLRKKEVPNSFSVKAIGILVPTNFPLIGEFLKFIGYTKPYVRLNLLSSYEFNREGLKVYFTSAVQYLGAVKAEGEIKKITKKLTQLLIEGRVPLKVIERRGELKELKLSYKDFGLFKMFINSLSIQQGERPEKVKEELIGTVREALKGSKEIEDKVGNAIISFIKEPSCLELKLNPEPPIKVGEIINMLSHRPKFEELLKRINLKVKKCS